ncbi:MAG: nitroreductase/quinone reductase family protein [Pseudomonadota bacterium]
MKIPKFLFRFLNPIVIALLHTPLHRIFSSSVVALFFTGRRSGRKLSTPVRYLRQDDTLTILTNDDSRWWPNFSEPTLIEVQLQGERRGATAQAHTPPDPLVRTAIRDMLTAHPADAAYLDIERDSSSAAVDGQWEHRSFEAAVAKTVIVRVTLAAGA